MNRLVKLFHRHDWVYYGYVPYGFIGYPGDRWGTATYRKCSKCKEIQHKWTVK